MGGITMDYIIKYWKEKETNPIEFLNHFRCTTEPIGGGTEHDDDGELVHYDAAIAAISIAKKELINKACEWLSKKLYIHTEEIEDKFWNETKTCDWVTSDYDSVRDFIEDFKQVMEEQL